MVERRFPRVGYPSNESTAYGYLARPECGRGPGVIVIQEWWGLTTHIVAIADRLAAEGFVAFAPDLFGGSTTHDVAEADRLMRELPVARAARDLGGAVDYLLRLETVTSSSVGAVGFCMGGGFVLVLAAQQGHRIGAAVPFYGVLGEEYPDFGELSAPVLGHFGEQDTTPSPVEVRMLAERIETESGRCPEFRFYPAGHAFLNDENVLGTYDPVQADKAWRATLDFLRANLS